ncbi:MAG: hypothetical protein H0U75_07180 [Legionella sp.]|nr:hypothetical protein [Legionella sp.]
MLSCSDVTSSEVNQKIELILILQAHPIPGNYDEINHMEIVFSQLNIMKIVPHYSNAAVLLEGLTQDIQPTERVSGDNLKFIEEMFPKRSNFCDLDFEQLTLTQKRLLNNKESVLFLFQLGLISCIYKTVQSGVDKEKALADYAKTYSESLKNFPRLLKKATGKKIISLRDLNSISELQDYQKFEHVVQQKNPDMFIKREKDALDSVLVAAKKSGKKHIILIFGKAHASGFVTLINTIYRDRITLKNCIDSTEGFYGPDNIKKLQLERNQALDDYESCQYQNAKGGFERAVSFWRATPNSTAPKLNFLLDAEFNLGSCLYKMAETNQISYKTSIPHLKHANTLVQILTTSDEDIKKVSNLFFEAVKRHRVISFFNKRHMPPTIAQLITSYSDENESQLEKVLASSGSQEHAKLTPS